MTGAMRRLVGAMRSLLRGVVRGVSSVCPAGVASMEGGAYKACRLATSPCPVEYSCGTGCSDVSM